MLRGTAFVRHLISFFFVAMIRAASLVVLWAVLFGLVLSAPLRAQPAVPRIERAEAFFEQGIESFEAGDFSMAYRRLRVVYSTFSVNRKTTAAYLMAGKALYREGDYAAAIDHLSRFETRYPTSGFRDEARATLARAREAKAAEGAAPPPRLDLGILLPLTGSNAALTQTLFNGIRLAVDEHNAAPGALPVRMVFRDSGGAAATAREATAALVAEDVDLIIGPLFSGEAAAAAPVAERAGVVLVPPLATDESVSEGRDFVFQANVPIAVRGREMARFAVDRLNLQTFGILSEHDAGSVSERMAEGFQQEAMELGADVLFYSVLSAPDGWSRLPEAVAPGVLDAIQAVYLPLSGTRSQASARAALGGLAAMGSRARILGNTEWHDLGFIDQAALFAATYTSDFYLDEGSGKAQDFFRRYRQLSGRTLAGGDIKLAVTGFDVARFLIQVEARPGGLSTAERLRAAPPYEGLGKRIDFDGGNANRGLYVLMYRNGGIERLR